MPKRFVLVDDDIDILKTLRVAIELDGHEARGFTSSPAALAAILEDPPDYVLADLIMPEIDGIELCERLRAEPRLSGLRIAVISGKTYHTDRQRALEAGADGFIAKLRTDPVQMHKEIMALFERRLTVNFWGCRGTMPVPGEKTLRYGGNTSCVSLRFPDDHLYVFDAGTGIKPLSDRLSKERKKRNGTILISHAHWDHLNFLPFFAPLYTPGNAFEIVGPAQGKVDMRQLVANQMDGLHFPITPGEFGAQVKYVDLGEGSYTFGPARVDTLLLCHPGRCLGYRVHFEGRTFCYVTDNELYPSESDQYSANYVKRLAEFVAKADILITDVTYTDDEYRTKINWGHSSVSAVADLVARAEVECLYLHHHGPGQDDDAIERKLDAMRERVAELGGRVECRVAAAGEEIELVAECRQ